MSCSAIPRVALRRLTAATSTATAVGLGISVGGDCVVISRRRVRPWRGKNQQSVCCV